MENSLIPFEFAGLLVGATTSFALQHRTEYEEDNASSRANAAVEATEIMDAVVVPRFVILLFVIVLQRVLQRVAKRGDGCSLFSYSWIFVCLLAHQK